MREGGCLFARSICVKRWGNMLEVPEAKGMATAHGAVCAAQAGTVLKHEHGKATRDGTGSTARARRSGPHGSPCRPSLSGNRCRPLRAGAGSMRAGAGSMSAPEQAARPCNANRLRDSAEYARRASQITSRSMIKCRLDGKGADDRKTSPAAWLSLAGRQGGYSHYAIAERIREGLCEVLR